MDRTEYTIMEDLDYVQKHVLNIITTMMNSYDLTVENIQGYRVYADGLPPEHTFASYEEYKQFNSVRPEPALPMYVNSRREFCEAINRGVKICPRYSSCDNESCERFHIRSDRICPHVIKGNYCNEDGCDLIVIRPCRKGKRCNDPECSFRH